MERESFRTYKSRRRLQTRSDRGKRRIFGRKSLFATGVALILVAAGLVLMSMQTAGVSSTPTPTDDTLRLTVPKMQRVENVPVYTSSAHDEESLGAGTVHLNDTGYPWEVGSNVYIAGHRLGYPNTKSFLVFYDLNKLEAGDRVVLKDSLGTRYIYQVYNRFVTTPEDLSVTQPVGKNIVSLQTCTLPDYSQRLVVQAELVRSEAQVA
ncbi:MAG: class E sortase [Rubrobacteraceae bacterium]